jgi:hypothetical protein
MLLATVGSQKLFKAPVKGFDHSTVIWQGSPTLMLVAQVRL